MNESNPIASQMTNGLLIDGTRRPGSGPTFEHRNPATGAVQASFALGSAADIDDAVAVARAGRAAWRSTPAPERGRILHALADLLLAHTEELSLLSAHEIGTPLAGGSGGVYLAALWTRYYAGWADKLDGAVVSASPVPGLDYVVPEPYGVIGVIVPWNSPLVALGMKAAPALAAGNTVVVKPPELAPASPIRFAELAMEAGLPAGVLQIVPGGPEAGDALVRHRHVDKVTFTGGTATGRAVMGAAAETLKPVVLELGGKSANIVFPDADLTRAVAMSVQLSLVTLSGQGCVLPTRLYVHDDIYDDVQVAVAGAARQLMLGDPLDPATQVGPVVTGQAQERILGVVDQATGHGAELLAGGGPGEGSLAEGFYVQPTVLGGVDHKADVAREEIFGPVLPIMRFGSDDEVLEQANDSDYGLGAYVHTNDLRRAQRFAAELEAGSVHINGFSGMNPGAPFGGIKRSGYGREGGRAGIEEFVRSKNVFIAS